MLGKLKTLKTNTDGSQDITITVTSDCRELFDELKNTEVDFDIKRHRKKRSLDANAKCWVMIDQLAEKLRMRKTEVYRHAIQQIGGVSDIVCVRDHAAKTLCDNWEKHGEGWMTETSPSKLPGCINVKLWYGSSTYDTKQMADLIGELVEECSEQGIPTMSGSEVDKLIEAWGKKVEKHEQVDTST